jgi:hypothetical protein
MKLESLRPRQQSMMKKPIFFPHSQVKFWNRFSLESLTSQTQARRVRYASSPSGRKDSLLRRRRVRRRIRFVKSYADCTDPIWFTVDPNPFSSQTRWLDHHSRFILFHMSATIILIVRNFRSCFLTFWFGPPYLSWFDIIILASWLFWLCCQCLFNIK